MKSSRSTGTPELICDSVDFRADLTRVYGKLTGTPHTSHRIDAVKLQTGGLAATDIDGVDFKRWFQWEDDGAIPVEIDFPPMKERSSIVIEAITPRGTAIWTIETVPACAVKRKRNGK
ncbi:MAG: hypothetical protein K2H39_08160 [Paramuribaculum sp.]|nr:hypothetical protein [Paramuribaculum sp.]